MNGSPLPQPLLPWRRGPLKLQMLQLERTHRALLQLFEIEVLGVDKGGGVSKKERYGDKTERVNSQIGHPTQHKNGQ